MMQLTTIDTRVQGQSYNISLPNNTSLASFHLDSYVDRLLMETPSFLEDGTGKHRVPITPAAYVQQGQGWIMELRRNVSALCKEKHVLDNVSGSKHRTDCCGEHCTDTRA